MSVVSGGLLRDLQAELKPLVADLRARCEEHPEVDAVVRAEWDAASATGRTARSYAVWRDDHLTNVAVAWLLALVFVRFCEDNDLMTPPLLGGPGDRREVARGHRTLYFQQHPGDGDREWLLEVFHRARRLPGLADVLGAHNPVWSIGPTADGARRLIEFWEKVDPDTGLVRHDFSDPTLDTRFLGDLYQDLSDTAKKQYALLQTPIFVEEFILGRTLDPAIAEFGLDDVALIDPTCGSGHFLLGAFARLSAQLAERHAGEAKTVIAQRALHAIAGVDLNPAAVAIARFRLLVAALRVSGARKLADLPAFELNVAVGDSLLHGRIPGQTLDIASGDMAALYQHAYTSEDVEQAKRILFRRYHAVVGNPPYITVKDAAMNAAYRNMFGSCSGKYALSVPFFERFFDLAQVGDQQHRAGYVGMITANSFMKRQMGKTLVEQFIPSWNLTHVIDTSGAYIPGHGTPTVIIFGRHQHPTTPTVRGVLGTRGEPNRPTDPANGVVWTSIAELVDSPGTENAYVTITDLDRTTLARHPWSIGGGGAAELKERLDSLGTALMRRTESIGITAFTLEDDVFIPEPSPLRSLGIVRTRPMCLGDSLRDWIGSASPAAIWPYDSRLALRRLEHAELRYLWPFKTNLSNNKMFGAKTKVEAGLAWYEYGRMTGAKLRTPLSIAFAFVATHNQFVLDRGGKVFNRSAPVIKLPAGASVEDHLVLLGLLNSSAACFWMKQVFHCKGSTVDAAGARQTTVPFEDFYEFDGTKLQQLPMPVLPMHVRFGELLDRRSSERSSLTPESVAAAQVPTREVLDGARGEWAQLTEQMIAAQEELDWYVYGLYGLLDGDEFTCPLDEVPPVRLGERAFEIVMARQIRDGDLETTWFTRHGSNPITEIPAHWPEAYRELVARRIERIETDRDIALIERPECKRRWASEPWDTQVERALRTWLLDRLEDPRHWDPKRIMTTRALAEAARTDPDFVQVAELYRGHDVDLIALVTELVANEAVPFLAAWRYTPDGMRVRAEWEHTWELQRREDAGDDVGTIPVPPKYARTDFAKPTYWPLRGKLDVAKERFISYPGITRDNDPTPLVGWAGWNHLDRAQALAAWYADAADAARPDTELVPLLAGLWELCPWLRQWHNDIDPTYGERLGDFFTTYTQTQATQLGHTTDTLTAWRPPAPTTRTRART